MSCGDLCWKKTIENTRTATALSRETFRLVLPRVDAMLEEGPIKIPDVFNLALRSSYPDRNCD